MKTIYLLVVLALCVLGISTMALNGPIVTWYRPCGLGVVIFEKSTQNIWQATINLDLYHHLDIVNIYINFEDNMEILAVSKRTKGKISRKGNNFTFSLIGTIPRQYTIYLKFVNGSSTSIPRVSSFQLNNIVMCNDMIKDAVKVESFNVTEENDTSLKHMCGQRSLISSEINEIMADAKAGDWPWHVAILIRRPRTNLANYQCGGSVISSTAILTAGHCVFKGGNLIETKRLVVEAGLVDLRSKNQTGKQILDVQKVILHPDYNILHATSDLAILVVNKLSYTEYVQPICLWGPLYDKSTLIGRRAVMTGFGTTENDVLSSTLRSVYTLVQNDTTCIAFNTNLYTSLLNEFTFCAGLGPEFGVNPRNGDSGGGLTVSQTSIDNRVVWFLRGVLSKCGQPKGFKFCDPKYYVVYTDVAPHYGWIYHNGGFL